MADPFSERVWYRAQRYIADGQHAAARAALEALLVRMPDNVQARVLLATVCLGQNHLRDACVHLRIAATHLSGDPDAIGTVAYCLHRVGESVAMRECLARPINAGAHPGAALAYLAHMHELLGQHRCALALMDQAKASGLNTPEFRYYRCLQLEFNGRIGEAEHELTACISESPKGAPTMGRALLALARMRKQTSAANHLDAIATRLKDTDPDSEDHAALEFARFKELDDLEQPVEAWAALERGNAIMATHMDYDPGQDRRNFRSIADICSTAFVSQSTRLPDGPIPIFIIGMPRSGTTLLERILSNHSQVATCGELDDFTRQMRWVADAHGTTFVDAGLLERARNLDYAAVGNRYLEQTRWRAGGKRFYIDKMPANFLLAGFIHRALPRARILHTVRDPVDTCFSNWKTSLGDAYGYSYDLSHIAAYYRQYLALMAHWHRVMPDAVLDVRYADLVRDPETVATQVLDFCGLPHQRGLTNIARNPAPVATLSSVQVRQLISIAPRAAWKPYALQMEPVVEALKGCVNT